MDVSAVARGAVVGLAQNQYQSGHDWATELAIPVLLGTDPGTLKPQPIKTYDMQVNLAAAKAAGVTIPPALVAKAVKKFGD
jgi:putative ABC transport system substrate-binding protein